MWCSWDESLPIKITPASGTLEEAGHPNDHTTIKCEFYGGTLGVFRALAMIQLEHQQDRALDISATVVEQTVPSSSATDARVLILVDRWLSLTRKAG